MSSAKRSGRKAREPGKVPGLAKTFGENVRRLRNEQGLSQEELADEVDMAVTYLGQIERGSRNPTLDIVERIARVLKVKALDLLQKRAS